MASPTPDEHAKHDFRPDSPVRRLRVVLLFAAGLFALCACKPDIARTDPHAELAMAWDDYRSGDFRAAIEEFERVRANTKEGSDDNNMALLGLATTWDLRRPDQNRELAATYYGKLADVAPKSEAAAWGLFALARMKHMPPVGKNPDYPAVRAAYQDVIGRFPGHAAAEEAFLYQQSAWLATLTQKDAQTARDALEKYLRNHAGTKYRSAIYDLLAASCRTLDLPKERLAYSIKSLDSIEIDPTNPRRDKAGAYWRIASEAEFRAGDFETARKYYNLLIREYPIDQRVFPAKLALERMDGTEAKIRAELNDTPATR